MAVRLFLAASVPILCIAHRRAAKNDVHEAELYVDRGLEKGHVLQFLPASLQEEGETYRLPSDSNGNNGNGGLIWGIITGVVIVLLVLCSYCYFHFSLLPELEGDGQSGNAQEIEEGERGLRLVRDLKFTEAEADEAEQCLRTKYMWVLPLYRKLSSEETSEGGSSPDHISQFGVSKRSLMRILGPEGINIFDKATMTQAKASELYKQANCVPQDVAGFKVRCDAMLCRFQFAELLVRIAICKWPEKSKAESLESLFEELAILCQKYSGDMRELITSGSTDEVQAVYEAVEPQTWAVFVEMASVHENVHGEKFMTLEDWRKLLNRMNIFVLYPVVKRKYGAYTYRMGLEPQADEQYNKTWQLMSFLEFQRALGAVMFLSEMRPKKECKPDILAALLQKIATENLSQIATAKSRRKKNSVLEGKTHN